MDYSLFMMPLHPPGRNVTETLQEDRQAIVLGDRLGFKEAYVGEHATDAAETVTSCMVFLATLAEQTKHIKLGTGTLNLPNPNSGTDAVTLADGRQLLVYNHTTTGRRPLNVAISTDGKKWSALGTLEVERGEFSYPAVIQTADGMVQISYTWKRQKVRVATLDPKGFQPEPIAANGRWPEGR